MFKIGMIHVYYGDGQGKTCAAVGLAVRLCGCGGRTLYAQFLKNGKSGELNTLRLLANGIKVLEGEPCTKFIRDMDEQEKARAIAAQQSVFHAAIEAAKTEKFDLLVMDEIIDAVDLQLIKKDELLDFLKQKPETLEVALTGHAIMNEFLDIADYVSEIRKVKHPYDRGMKARRGAEF
jgi:cob(I)alamin adenosyltransferase